MYYLKNVWPQDEKFDADYGPKIEELVAKEEVDILPYVGWEPKPEPDKTKRKPASVVLNTFHKIYSHYFQTNG